MMDAVTGDVAQKITYAMNELTTPRLDAALQTVDDQVEDYLDRMERHHGRLNEQAAELTDHLATVLGASDRAELAEVIVDQAARRLSAQLETIIRGALEHSGIQLRENAMGHLRRGENGRVYVATDPALIPPGTDVVIDGR